MIDSGWQKSSYSAEAGNCLELRWQKSSHSRDSSNGLHIATALLRESDTPATVLATTPTRIAGLLTAIKTERLC